MAIALVVTQPFGAYAKGDRITDPRIVSTVLADLHHHVVKITVPDAPQPTQTAAPAKA